VDREGNFGINDVTKNLELLKNLVKESLDKLESVEYTIGLLRRELESYNELIDKELFVPKLKFVKERFQRFIKRMKFSEGEILACIGISISIEGSVEKAERNSILGYLINYLDSHIRPGDILFKVSEDTIGIFLVLKSSADLEKLFNRLNAVLFNLKTRTYSDRNVVLNFKMRKFIIPENASVNWLVERFKALK